MKKTPRRIHVFVGLVALLAMLAAASPGSAQGAQPDGGDIRATRPVQASDRVDAHKAPTSRLAETDPSLLGRTDATPERVVIKFDYDSTATYSGGVAGLAATSPETTGVALTGDTAAERAYEAYVADREAKIKAAISAAVPDATFGRSLRVVYGGVSAVVPANRVADVLAIDGVVAVQVNALRQPLTDSSPEFVNAPPAYDVLGGTTGAGAGVIYGNLDTGIWPEHPSFEDLGNLAAPPGPARECNYGDNPLTVEEDVFVCQNKLIGGAHMTDDYDAGPNTPDPYAGTARDGDGHGTHTSSTSAGNRVADVEVLGVNRGTIHGLAPGAWVIEYKVCGPDGCVSSDSAAAVGQAILDGVDVINFSISGGTQPFTDPVELAFLDAYAANLFVSASAGNDGPGAGTANHLSPWVTTVAASTQTREFASTLTLDGAGDPFVADGASITAGAGPARVMLAERVPNYDGGKGCAQLAEPGDFIVDGQPIIVACQRGGQARVWKGFVAFSGDAAGMILYNPTLADIETDNHWLPTVHLADGTDFVAFMKAHNDVVVTGEFPAGEAREGQGDVMAAFSSRGPAGNFIKPDVTAPGVQILAGASPTPPEPDPVSGGSPPGELFQAIAGTSMSSPHVAGAAILARAVHPDWTPGQIKSALMTTAVTDVVKEDTVTPADPFDFGAGRIDVGESIFAPITFDETAENFALMGNDPANAHRLNIPSINAPIMPGRLVTTRTAENASGLSERFEVTTEAPVGSTITVSPRRFTVEPGGSVELTITIESDADEGELNFGTIWLQSRSGALMHMPVAWIHTQGDVSLVQSCSPQTVQKGGLTDCTVEAANDSFEDQEIDLDTFLPDNFTVQSVDGATIVDPHHVQAHDIHLDGIEPGIPAVDPGVSPGYLPLDAFGIDPIAIGDEEIINFNITGALLEFTGQSFNRIGVDSNGYALLGGGTVEDNNCCNLPAGPDPERPNDVLAPFWTDLDGTAAPGILIGFLANATDEWLVIEFRLDVFGTSDERRFQVWIGTNSDGDDDDSEDITYAYSAAQTDPAGQDFLVGAENALGQGDMEAVLPSGDLRVTSSDMTPGDVASYTITAKGNKVGTGDVTTEMTASGTAGVTIVRTEVRVIARPGGAVPV